MVISKSKFVVLRAKKITSGWSLYLDIHYNKQRHREYLRLYVNSTVRRLQSVTDRQTLQIAETIKAQRQLEINTGTYGQYPEGQNYSDGSIADYFDSLALIKKNNNSPSKWKWLSCASKVRESLANLPFDKLTPSKIDAFKTFLTGKLGQNTASTYWQIFTQGIKQAHRDGIIQDNPLINYGSGISRIEAKREFLLIHELKLFNEKECNPPDVKRAFMFSCFTGLRFGDIYKLKYEDIRREDGNYMVYFRQNKTQSVEWIYLPKQALKYIDIGKTKGRIFELKDLRSTNEAISEWRKSFGFEKHITFHCARHTFATTALNVGIEIKTVSKMLGHKEVRTTEIYAKLLDNSKKIAADRLPEL